MEFAKKLENSWNFSPNADNNIREDKIVKRDNVYNIW